MSIDDGRPAKRRKRRLRAAAIIVGARRVKARRARASGTVAGKKPRRTAKPRIKTRQIKSIAATRRRRKRSVRSGHLRE